LKPGTAVVQVDGINRCELAINSIEDVFFVAFVVKDGELGRIKKSSGVESVDLKKNSQFLPP
jgi:hypothetical protein